MVFLSGDTIGEWVTSYLKSVLTLETRWHETEEESMMLEMKEGAPRVSATMDPFWIRTSWQ